MTDRHWSDSGPAASLVRLGSGGVTGKTRVGRRHPTHGAVRKKSPRCLAGDSRGRVSGRSVGEDLGEVGPRRFRRGVVRSLNLKAQCKRPPWDDPVKSVLGLGLPDAQDTGSSRVSGGLSVPHTSLPLPAFWGSSSRLRRDPFTGGTSPTKTEPDQPSKYDHCCPRGYIGVRYANNPLRPSCHSSRL